MTKQLFSVVCLSLIFVSKRVIINSHSMQVCRSCNKIPKQASTSSLSKSATTLASFAFNASCARRSSTTTSRRFSKPTLRPSIQTLARCIFPAFHPTSVMFVSSKSCRELVAPLVSPARQFFPLRQPLLCSSTFVYVRDIILRSPRLKHTSTLF